jgi:hypothetical protein
MVGSVAGLTVIVCWQLLELFPLVAVQVRVIVLPQDVPAPTTSECAITAIPQLFIAVATPVDVVSVLAPQATVTFAGQVITGTTELVNRTVTGGAVFTRLQLPPV